MAYTVKAPDPKKGWKVGECGVYKSMDCSDHGIQQGHKALLESLSTWQLDLFTSNKEVAGSPKQPMKMNGLPQQNALHNMY